MVYDPACDLDGAKKTFLSCANDDVMDTFEFYGDLLPSKMFWLIVHLAEWVVRTFGNLDDGEYQKGETL